MRSHRSLVKAHLLHQILEANLRGLKGIEFWVEVTFYQYLRSNESNTFCFCSSETLDENLDCLYIFSAARALKVQHIPLSVGFVLKMTEQFTCNAFLSLLAFNNWFTTYVNPLPFTTFDCWFLVSVGWGPIFNIKTRIDRVPEYLEQSWVAVLHVHGLEDFLELSGEVFQCFRLECLEKAHVILRRQIAIIWW